MHGARAGADDAHRHVALPLVRVERLPPREERRADSEPRSQLQGVRGRDGAEPGAHLDVQHLRAVRQDPAEHRGLRLGIAADFHHAGALLPIAIDWADALARTRWPAAHARRRHRRRRARSVTDTVQAVPRILLRPITSSN
ncbi:hypothetical protein ON010_g16784 [Phytophthora cinnamomi]|nr:hypothetical protein ON010_g16784 [Phytophthora cinnamomi]